MARIKVFDTTTKSWVYADKSFGKDGTDGKDGVSPTVAVNKSGKVTTISITDKNGTKNATINDGTDGTHGKDGTSVTVKSVSESTVDGGNNVVTFSDGKTLIVKNGTKGTAGTSVTVSNISESSVDGGNNIITFSDGKTLTVKNGGKGSPGKDGTDASVTATSIKNALGFTPANEETVSQLSENNVVVPDYWKTELDEGVEAINTALCTAGRKKSMFLFYSDAHWNYGSQVSPALLKYLYQNTGMTKTFYGGDIINDKSTDYDGMAYLWDWRKQLKNLPNHHSVAGNHDGGDNGIYFAEQYVYGYLLAAEETFDIVRGDKGLYYYMDNPCEKTRYLCLDTGCQDYSSLSDEQMTFIVESLKSTPDGWHIVVVAHIWYEVDYDQYNIRPIPIKGISATASSVLAILDNYNSRNGEFSDCGAWVEFCIGGHVHYDYDAKSSTGIPIILVETDSQHTRGNYTYTAGTTTEASVNGIIADYTNHKIHVVRIGRGESRDVNITNYIVEYHNVLDDAGFVEDKYISASSGFIEKDKTGVDLTGYIAVKHGDIIRLKNVTMPDADGYTNMVYHFSSSKVGKNSIPMLSSRAGTVYKNGNLVEFTIAGKDLGWDGGAEADVTGFIRIGAANIDSTSIITVNEPVE